MNNNKETLIVKRILKIILLISWMILIFMLSHQNGSISSKQSDTVLKFIPRNFVSNEMILITMVRKLAHIVEYFVLFVLIYTNIKEYKSKNLYKLSFTLSLLYSSFDEFHQVFITDRSGSIIDVLIDAIGIIIACILIKYINSKRIKFKQ